MVRRDSTFSFLGIEFMVPIRYQRKKLHLLECEIPKGSDFVGLFIYLFIYSLFYFKKVKMICIFLFLFFFNWGIVVLQCCVSFRCTAK